MSERKRLELSEDDGMKMSYVPMGGTFQVGDEFRINAEGIRGAKSEPALERQVHSSDLKADRELGRGACSTVRLVRHLRTNERFALKRFNVHDREKRKQLVTEIQTLVRVCASCTSLITLFGAYKSKENIYVILEHMDRGSLDQIVRVCGKIPENVLAALTYQVLWGLAYLHYEGVLHRDIKPSNILANSSGEVKLTDFGIAKELDESTMATTQVGTWRYMDITRLTGQPYGAAGDIWSLGIMLVEISTRQLPFKNCDTQVDLIQALGEMDMDDMVPSDKYADEFCEVVKSCLIKSQEKRLTAAALLDSPFFEMYNISSVDGATPIVREWLDEHPSESKDDLLAESKMISTMHSDWSGSEDDSDSDCKGCK